MVVARCIKRFTDSKGKVVGFRICDSNNTIRDIKTDELKQAMLLNKIEVVNLRLADNYKLFAYSEFDDDLKRYITAGEIDFRIEKGKKQLLGEYTLKQLDKKFKSDLFSLTGIESLYEMANKKYNITRDEFKSYFVDSGSHGKRWIHCYFSGYMAILGKFKQEEYKINLNDISLYNAALSLFVINNSFMSYSYGCELKNTAIGLTGRAKLAHALNVRVDARDLADNGEYDDTRDYLYLGSLMADNRLDMDFISSVFRRYNQYGSSNEISHFERELKRSILDGDDNLYNAIKVLSAYINNGGEVVNYYNTCVVDLMNIANNIDKDAVRLSSKILNKLISNNKNTMFKLENRVITSKKVDISILWDVRSVINYDESPECMCRLNTGYDDWYVLTRNMGGYIQLQLSHITDNRVDETACSVRIEDDIYLDNRISRFLRLMDDWYTTKSYE